MDLEEAEAFGFTAENEGSDSDGFSDRDVEESPPPPPPSKKKSSNEDVNTKI